MTARHVDLNADLGESYGAWTLGDDEALLDVVTSANVACGFHAGDPLTIERTVALAAARGVRVGAQVSYPDLVGFGRRAMSPSSEQLRADVLYQIGALAGFCRTRGVEVSYVKAHGALYNRILTDEVQARAVTDAVRRWDASLPLLILPGSVAAQVAAETGLMVLAEGYADRGYDAAGRLVARGDQGALLTDPGEVAQRAVRMAVDGLVVAVDGTEVAVQVDSICVHGDTPGAAEIAQAVRADLQAAGVEVRA